MSNPDNKALTVFISYSRAQVDFADELALFLSDKGHEVLIDRHNISSGEAFKARLRELIRNCDTIVFILSDESATSSVCAWEIEEAERMMKRILVVTIADLSADVHPPQQLAKIDWVHCWQNPSLPGSGQIRGLLTLDSALRADLAWLRKRTEYQRRAFDWNRRGMAADSPILLRGVLLEEATQFVKNAPGSEPIPDDVTKFITASTEYNNKLESEAVAQANAIRRRTYWGIGVAAVFAIMAFLGAWMANGALTNLDRTRTVLANEVSDAAAEQARSIFEKEVSDHSKSLLMAMQALVVLPSLEDAERWKTSAAFLQIQSSINHHALIRTLTLPTTGDKKPQIYSIALLNKGDRVFAGTDSGRIYLLNIQDRTIERELGCQQSLGANTICHSEAVTSLSLSEDQSRMVSGSEDQTIILWNVHTGEAIERFDCSQTGVEDTAVCHADRINAVSLSDDGEYFASGSTEGVVLYTDVTSGSSSLLFRANIEANDKEYTCGNRTNGDVDCAVRSVSLASDGVRVAAGLADGTARIWNAKTRELVASFTHGAAVRVVLFAGSDQRLITVDAIGDVYFWDINSGENTHKFVGQHSEWVSSIAVSADQSRLVTGSADTTAIIWDVDTQSPIKMFGRHSDFIRSISLTDDGTILATGSADGTIKIWNASHRLSEPSLLLYTAGQLENSVETSAADIKSELNLAAIGDETGFVGLWDIKTGDLLASFTDHTTKIGSITISDDGSRMAAASNEMLIVWDIETNQELWRFSKLTGEIGALSFKPGGEQIVAGFLDGSLGEWLLKDEPKLQWYTGAHRDAVTSIDISGTGHLIVTGSNDRFARRWDAQTREMLKSYGPHLDHVTSVAISDDGTLLASGSKDGTARVWSLSDDRLIATMTADDAFIQLVDLAERHPWILTSDDKGRIKVWDIAESMLLSTNVTRHGAVLATRFSADQNELVSINIRGGFEQIVPAPGVASRSQDILQSACALVLESGSQTSFDQTDFAEFRILAGMEANSYSVFGGDSPTDLAEICEVWRAPLPAD